VKRNELAEALGHTITEPELHFRKSFGADLLDLLDCSLRALAIAGLLLGPPVALAQNDEVLLGSDPVGCQAVELALLAPVPRCGIEAREVEHAAKVAQHLAVQGIHGRVVPPPLANDAKDEEEDVGKRRLGQGSCCGNDQDVVEAVDGHRQPHRHDHRDRVKRTQQHAQRSNPRPPRENLSDCDA
jgi:hypothetical protein